MSPQRDATIKSYFKPIAASRPISTESVSVSESSIAHNKRKTSTSPPPTKKLKANDDDKHPHLDYRNLATDWLEDDNQAEATQDTKKRSLQLTYHKGDIFANAPPGTVLVHACNTQGHWGAGIAKAFKDRYPKAFTDHHKFCAKEHSKSKDRKSVV